MNWFPSLRTEKEIGKYTWMVVSGQINPRCLSTDNPKEKKNISSLLGFVSFSFIDVFLICDRFGQPLCLYGLQSCTFCVLQ